MYKKSYVCIVFIYAFIQTVHHNYTFFLFFFFIFPENVQKKKHFEKEKNDIWQCNSIAKTFLFNINLELQKSDENWRRNNTLKSAHTVKKQLGENANEMNQMK